jgi:hypothetical protein
MEPLKKHGDPLEEEINEQQPARTIDEVTDNQPGSKGRRDEEDQPIVRSASQTPNSNQPSDDATMEPGGDLGQKRTTM